MYTLSFYIVYIVLPQKRRGQFDKAAIEIILLD